MCDLIFSLATIVKS